MRGCLILVVAALSLATGQARAEPRFVPLVGAELGQARERLSLMLPGYRQQEDRWLWSPSLLLGLGARLPALGGVSLRSDSTLALGVVLHTGHLRMEPRQAVLAELPLGAGFWLLAGPGLGLGLDVGSSARSALELAVPLGVRFRSVELLYRPALLVPLGSEEQAVFGGKRELSARPGFSPFALSLRVRLGALGFGE